MWEACKYGVIGYTEHWSKFDGYMKIPVVEGVCCYYEDRPLREEGLSCTSAKADSEYKMFRSVMFSVNKVFWPSSRLF